MKTALLVIAHGSREEAANADLNHFVAGLRQLPGFDVAEGAYLELAAPNIDEAAERCVAAAPRRVVLLPYFLSPGIHVGRDLTDAQQRLAARYPDVEFLLAEPLGRHPLLLDILAERARQACHHDGEAR